MLNKLKKSFLIECLLNSMIAVLVAMSILLMLQFGRIAPMIFNSVLSPSILFKAIFLLIPAFLAICLPISVFIGVLVVFTRLYRDGEWIALKAAGIGSSRLLGLIVAMCLVVSVFVIALSNFLVPVSLAKVDQLLLDQSAKAILSRIEAGRIINLGGGNSIFIKHKLPDGRWDSPMLITETTDSRKVVYAQFGQLEIFADKRVLKFVNGVLEQENKQEFKRASFAKLEFVLDDLIGKDTDISLFSSIQLVQTPTLFKQLGAVKNDITALKIKGEISRRIATSLAVFIFGLLAYGLMGKVWIKSAAMVYALASAVTLAYYLLERIGLVLGEKLVLDAWLGSWLPIIVLVLLLPFVMHKREW